MVRNNGKSVSIISLSDISGKQTILLKASQSEESIDGQLRECKAFAEKNGITLLSTYVYRALSAKTDNPPTSSA